MSYSKGYRQDPAYRRTQKSSRLRFGTSPTPPPSASLEQYEYTPILDQNQCGSCTGHGTAQGLYVAFKAAGSPLSYCPSPKDTYATTRALERAASTSATLPPLTDSGAMPADVMTAISQWGIRPMTAPSPQGFNSDVDPSNVNDEPNLTDLEADAEKVVVGEYRIDEQAADFVTQVMASVAAGVPVGIGVFVDTGFENWAPPQPPLNTVDMNDPNGGGHWLCITSYRTETNGKVTFRGPNSWSARWGDAGHFEVTEDWLKTSCSDAYALNVR